MSKKKKGGIKVGFSKAQHAKVMAFLEFIRADVEKDLGTPVDVKLDWSYENTHQQPYIHMIGSSGLEKTVFINDVLTATDANLPAPVVRPTLSVLAGGRP